MLIKYVSRPAPRRPGLLRKAAAIVGTILLAAIALMFSVVLLAIIAIGGLIGGAYLWWKTRELRAHLQARMQNFSPRPASEGSSVFGGNFEGNVIEGEAVRVRAPRDGGRR